MGSEMCIRDRVCITAYYVTDETKFYILAAAVGILMGGIQSLSRSTFSKLLPKEIGCTIVRIRNENEREYE